VFLAIALVASAPVDDRSNDMGILPTLPSVSKEVVSDDLVDAGVADDVTDDLLLRGPKVNGGYALNTLPTETGDNRVTNPDCAGYMIDGKCMKPLPHRSRLAVIEDNMLSPEQLAPSLYEPNLQQVNQQYFNQPVMQDNVEHLAGLPGYDVVEEEMNKIDSAPASVESDSMFPVGTGLMESNDAEVDSNGHAAKMNLEDCGDAGETMEGHQLPEEGGQPTNVVVPNSGPSSETDHSVLHALPVDCTQSMSLTSDSGEEIAMPIQAPSTLARVLNEEVGDIEDNIPMAAYDLEAEFSPSASPSPSTVPAPVHVHHRSKVALTQTSVTVKYDPTDMKANFLSLIAHCTRAASNGLDTSAESVSMLSTTLSKYHAALECAQSSTFPDCVPEEANTIIQTPPHHGHWKCF